MTTDIEFSKKENYGEASFMFSNIAHDSQYMLPERYNIFVDYVSIKFAYLTTTTYFKSVFQLYEVM